jgi:hypothetical protein
VRPVERRSCGSGTNGCDTDPTDPIPRAPVAFRLVTQRPSGGPVQYKGEDLDAERGPGLGCFRFQVALLIFLVVLTPLSVAWHWPAWLSAALLFAVIVLLLFAGQTIIFLLRLVAADRRSRRRPLASQTKTVGELEDAGAGDTTDPSSDPQDPVRQ